MTDLDNLMPGTDRFAVYRWLNGQAEDAVCKPRTTLVKTFLLEHVRASEGRQPKTPEQIFGRLGCTLNRIDETFYGVTVQDREGGKAVGHLEQYDERFLAFYTTRPSQEAKPLVSKWCQEPDLDCCWFNGQLLQQFWEQDVSKCGDNRFTKLVFKHDSIFEMPDSAIPPSEDGEDAESAVPLPDDDDVHDGERRNARFEMADRIGRIKKSLAKLQGEYAPLNALYSIRFPAAASGGSHNLFQHGQVTNHSPSFEEHRVKVRYFWRCYKQVLDATEEAAWEKPKKLSAALGGGQGVPLIVKFQERLSRETFDQWVSKAFQKRSPFKLWGRPIRLGPTKVHVYGADRHLWQPITMELTDRGVVALLPQGTCGNTFHRLVTNIQHYLSPQIEAWLGSRKFGDLLRPDAIGKEEPV